VFPLPAGRSFVVAAYRPQVRLAGKSAGYPGLPTAGRQAGEGGNGLPQWSQSRPCNHIYISRKPRPVGGASLLNIWGALHLALFEQPGKE
jgi:hypothetical protein